MRFAGGQKYPAASCRRRRGREAGLRQLRRLQGQGLRCALPVFARTPRAAPSAPRTPMMSKDLSHLLSTVPAGECINCQTDQVRGPGRASRAACAPLHAELVAAGRRRQPRRRVGPDDGGGRGCWRSRAGARHDDGTTSEREHRRPVGAERGRERLKSAAPRRPQLGVHRPARHDARRRRRASQPIALRRPAVGPLRPSTALGDAQSCSPADSSRRRRDERRRRGGGAGSRIRASAPALVPIRDDCRRACSPCEIMCVWVGSDARRVTMGVWLST